MYTANIVDTVVFRALGKPPNPSFKSLRQAAREAEAELWVPATIYKELLDGRVTGDSGPVNPYLDGAVEEGWLRIATPLSGSRDDGWGETHSDTEKARYLTGSYLNRESKYPETNNWDDSSIVGLIVRLFEGHERMRVITHTADEKLAKACTAIPPEFGYHDVRSEFYKPPQSVKTDFVKSDQLIW